MNKSSKIKPIQVYMRKFNKMKMGYSFFCIASLIFINTHIMDAQNLKIAFFINCLTVRGVEVSIYDYADFNETLLNNESFIIEYSPPNRPISKDYNRSVTEKFIKRFGNRYYVCANMQEMDCILSQQAVDILYIQKSGAIDDKISKVCKNAVHAVFPGLQVHGDAYATISSWLSDLYPHLKLPCVPLIVRMPDVQESLRSVLNIPLDALVFGRHGGFDSFDIPFVREAICEAASKHPNWYFIFLNTQQFCNLPNVIFLPATADMIYKARFINTCDAMIHARARGETFGLACAEFSINNKPVITWSGSEERNHIHILKNKGFYYTNKQDLLFIFDSFEKNKSALMLEDWDVYSQEFNPTKVMQKFNEVFIQPLICSQKV